MSEPTLFYDANCTLCRMWKEGIQASGWRSLRFEDANDAATAQRLGISDVAQLQRRMCLLMPDGTEAWGYDVLISLLRIGDGGHGIAALMSTRSIARAGRWIYERVAMSRSCANGHRGMPSVISMSSGG